MKKCIIFAITCLTIFGVFSCDFPERNSDIAFGQEFKLEYDRYVRLEDGASLRFLELKKDNRCPEDALCPYAGEAVIAITLEHEDRLGSVIELRIPGFIDRYSVGSHKSEEIWGYEIILLQLDPYPLIDHIEGKHKYVATLIVDKVAGEG